MLCGPARTEYRRGWWSAVSQGEEFDRGVAAGQIDQRLAEHDKHFSRINGSIADVASELHQVSLSIQRLGDQALSRDEAARLVSQALKDSTEQAAQIANKRWAPWARTLALITGVVGLLSIATTVILLFNN